VFTAREIVDTYDGNGELCMRVDHRLLSLDFLRGYGIITFIVWHCYAYFYKYPQGFSPVHRSTIGATGLFIFLGGFLVGNHYYAKLSATKDAASITKRLLIRAGKLILYVILANLLVAILMERGFNVGAFAETFRNLVSLLYRDRWDIPLQILIVIALGLICALPVILLHMRYGRRSSLFFLILLMGLYVFDILYPEHVPYLWRYLPLSLAGALLGLFLMRDIKRRVILGYGSACLAIAVGLCIASALSNRCYEYILFETGPYALLVATTCIGVGSFAYEILDVRKNVPRWLERSVILTGQQSLFVYIAQIVIIRLVALHFGDRTTDSDSRVLLMAAVIIAVCVALSNCVDRSRRYVVFDRLYRFLFA
jgi:hypothetical protein